MSVYLQTIFAADVPLAEDSYTLITDIERRVVCTVTFERNWKTDFVTHTNTHTHTHTQKIKIYIYIYIYIYMLF
jgi:hypothetical protein